MKRAEIKERINVAVSVTYTVDETLETLTDLFIELSAELCKEQVKLCERDVRMKINAPLPEIL